MDWVKVIVLGIIEGLTEFVPISSTGHLLVASSILRLPEQIDGLFEIFIQSGAVLAVVGYYRVELWRQVRCVHVDAATRRLWLTVLVAFIPAGSLGFLLTVTGILDILLSHIVVVALGWLVGGILFLIAEKVVHENGVQQSVETAPLTYRQALVVGVWQVLALVPGMSRSGMSIIGGLIAGLDRSRATQFSFYLALPTLGGATVFALLTRLGSFSLSDSVLLLVGMIVSGVVAWLSIGWLLRYVARHNFVWFGFYRIVAGGALLLLIIMTR